MMSNPQAGSRLAEFNSAFRLDYPHPVAIFSRYDEAQQAVDSLADRDFPVSNLLIVGTDLKLIERVTGKKTWLTVINQGVMSGFSTALMIAIIMMILNPASNMLSIILTALGVGISIGVGFAVIGNLMSKGKRDFTSISQTVPSRFEILCEHKFAAQARELLAQTPAGRAAAFEPSRMAIVPPAYPQQGYPQPTYPQQTYPTQPQYAPQPEQPSDQTTPPQN